MLNEFLKETKTVRSLETYKTYGFLLRPFETWLKTKNKSLEECVYNDIYAYLEIKKDWSNRTKWSFLNTVRQLFKWYRNHISPGATMQDLKIAFADRQRCDLIVDMKYPSYLKKQEASKKMVMSLEELIKLLNMTNKQDYIAVYLLAYFGMRKSELSALKKGEINFEKQELVIRTSKSYKTRKLYFNSYVQQLLTEFLKVNISSTAYFNNRLRIYSKAMGFRIFPHMFRHTFISNMVVAIKSLPNSHLIIKRLVGHTVSDVTDSYTHSEESDLRNAMIKFHYMNALNKKPLEEISENSF